MLEKKPWKSCKRVERKKKECSPQSTQQKTHKLIEGKHTHSHTHSKMMKSCASQSKVNVLAYMEIRKFLPEQPKPDSSGSTSIDCVIDKLQIIIAIKCTAQEVLFRRNFCSLGPSL